MQWTIQCTLSEEWSEPWSWQWNEQLGQKCGEQWGVQWNDFIDVSLSSTSCAHGASVHGSEGAQLRTCVCISRLNSAYQCLSANSQYQLHQAPPHHALFQTTTVPQAQCEMVSIPLVSEPLICESRTEPQAQGGHEFFKPRFCCQTNVAM